MNLTVPGRSEPVIIPLHNRLPTYGSTRSMSLRRPSTRETVLEVVAMPCLDHSWALFEFSTLD